MHIQDAPPGWTQALPLLPAGALVLSVSNGGTLREAKRINPGVLTAYRHFFADQQFSADYATAADIWRRNFRTFIDRTYLEQYLPFVDLVLEYNEYYDQGMAEHDPDTLRARLVTATAAANVWNDEYRGRLVRSADGGEGRVPAGCRLVIGNSPVGNDIPKAFAQLAIATDNVLGYHPYTRASVRLWPGTARDPGDWRWHSGRWNFMEQAWGLRPKWLFTEMMPYMGADEGWRHPVCLDGDADLLLELYRRWLVDLAATDAFKTGRVLGWTGAWFTLGGAGGWDFYRLEAPQLVALARAAAAGPRPGQEDPMPTNDEAVKIKAALAKLDEARAILQPLTQLPWWETETPPYKLAATGKTVGLYNADGSRRTAAPTERALPAPGAPADKLWDVWERKGALLRVTKFGEGHFEWWVKAADVAPA